MNNLQIRDILSIFIGFCFILWSLMSSVLIWLSKKWKPTKGTVLEANIKSAGFLSNNYSYNIKYSYIVDNKEYYATVIYASEYFLGRYGGNIIWLVKRELKGLQQGNEIVVYYNPRNPKIACIRTKQEYFYFTFFMGIGLIFLLLGILSWLGYIRISNIWA